MRHIHLLFLLILIPLVSVAQNEQVKVNWLDNIEYGLEGQSNLKATHFEEASYDFSNSNVPFLFREIPIKSNEKVDKVFLLNAIYEILPDYSPELIDINQIGSEVKIEIENSIVRKQNKAFYRVFPFRKNAAGQIERLLSFTPQFQTSRRPLQRKKKMSFASSSVLSSGEWFKIGITGTGVFKLNYNFLSNLGLDLASVDPRSIRLYGNGGGPLPEPNDIDRPDDLEENAIIVAGESDGKFNPGDYILFYGQGQTTWSYDTSRQLFRHNLNNYADTAFYFITADLGAGKRIVKTANPTGAASQVNSFDDYAHYENDLVNLIKSGQEWYGELFENQLTYNFSFDFPGIDLTQPGKIFVSAIARAGVTSNYRVNVDNTINTLSMGPTVLSRYEVGFAKGNSAVYSFNPNDNIVNVQMTYNKPQTVSKGWLNYLDINVRRNLNFSNGQMSFRDLNSVGVNPLAQYNISSQANFRVWDISDPYNVSEKTLVNQGSIKFFLAEASQLREFHAFNSYDSIQVFQKGRVNNQNLHGLSQTDMVIVSHPLFMNQANEIKSIHESEGLQVHLVTPQQIYNEYSSGAQDPVAIRSFVKMFYDRSTSALDLPSYLLIVGDASYDFKDRINGNTNFVISYQSRNSLDPVNSYVSDDYMVLLDDSEGLWRFSNTNPDRMDVSVGRLPVKTVAEAQGIVNKIKAYYNPANRGDWRNRISFVGDDGDGVTHMAQSNQLAYILELNEREYNLDKIFLDAYKRESTSSGPRYPAANEAIDRAVSNGSLIVNYTGHGGETGWAAERVLDISTILSWKNNKSLPLFMTATCEFSRFDDPLRTSAGELVLLNGSGGGIALMTTTRLVYSSPNYFLNQTFYNKIFERKTNGESKRLGEVMLEVKNINATQGNTRNFSLLGDPALKLAIPSYEVKTTEINNVPIAQMDTLKALSKATVSGIVTDVNGNQLNNFNGLIYPTVYDKEREKITLNNTGGGAFPYKVRESKIFKGKATVVNGAFSFEFIVPKDISYNFGQGKISYYADNGINDGNGYTEEFILGGSDPNAIVDNQGPAIELFMNDASFVYGGITNENPFMLANLSDEQGINTVGNGIGHDLVAILDQNTENALVLNDYYEAETDSYQRGSIRYPLTELAEGRHTLTLKAWDNANNSSEKTIEFNVVSAKDIKIENLVNYPNPFTTNTEFIFQHNQPGTPMDVKVEIFTVSGKLVKSIDQVVVSEGFLSRDIRWNGRDDFGDRIGKGVYVYKLKVRSRNGSVTEKYEKLVIL